NNFFRVLSQGSSAIFGEQYATASATVRKILSTPIKMKIYTLTISTPCLSARVMNTKNVDSTTDINGAIAGTQKYFLFFFP
ncbi:hypothetical protein Lal_00020171, partial [Lupinus albus]